MPKNKTNRSHFRIKFDNKTDSWSVGKYDEESINGFIGWNCYSSWPSYAQALQALDIIIREEFGTTIAEEEARKEQEEANKEPVTSQPRGKELIIRNKQ